MIDKLKPLSTAPLPCKICGAPAPLYGVVDFHKSCAEAQGVRLPLAGLPIYYRRCTGCNFLFTDAFDDWSHDQFKAHIYNDGYLIADPDYQSKRPRENGEVVARMFGQFKEQMRVLDYGGGNDVLCATLRAGGFPSAVTYDPMVPDHAHQPHGKFELITCFETLEHLPDPTAGIAAIVGYGAIPGLVFFTTYAQPDVFDSIGMHWWYIGPRNGHISVFSKQALTHAFGQHGYKVVSIRDNIHIAFHTLPPYIKLETPVGA
jgi:hypothetical protein